MEPYISEQELVDFKTDKATAPVVEKIKELTQTQFVPIRRMNDIGNELKTAKDIVTTLTAKVTEFEGKLAGVVTKDEHTRALEAAMAEATTHKTKAETLVTEMATLKASIDTVTKERDGFKKVADTFTTYKATQFAEAKKMLGPKWLPKFDELELTDLTKLVHDMTGKPLATIFTAAGGGSNQDVPLTAKEMIAKGLSEQQMKNENK